MRKISWRAAAMPLALLTAAATAGPIAYAPNGLFTSDPTEDDLVMFDVDDPAGYTVVGPMGVFNIGFGGMDFDADGQLYAYASLFKSTGGAASGLYRVDTQTGQATPVGNSTQSLEDLAFNPADGTMYGLRAQAGTTRLYTVNLTTGQVSLVGVLQSDPPIARPIGLAFDADGSVYVHDVGVDMIFKGTGLSLSPLHTIPQDTVFSQGMTIDWSRDDTGYHTAVGQGDFPNYFSQLNSFDTTGDQYTLGPAFGPNTPGGDGFNYPPVQLGDVAVTPASGPKPCGPADLAEPIGALNFSDVTAFLGLFNAGDMDADLAAPFGELNFVDITTFLSEFNAGCP